MPKGLTNMPVTLHGDECKRGSQSKASNNLYAYTTKSFFARFHL